MSYARAEWRQQVSQAGRLRGATRWDFTPGAEVDQRIGTALDRIWRRILDANRFYRMSLKPRRQTRRADTSRATCRCRLATRRSGSIACSTVDRQLRVRRQVRRRRGSVSHVAARVENAGGVTTGRRVWWRGGNFIYTLPIQRTQDRDALHGEPHPDRVRQALGRQRARGIPRRVRGRRLQRGSGRPPDEGRERDRRVRRAPHRTAASAWTRCSNTSRASRPSRARCATTTTLPVGHELLMARLGRDRAARRAAQFLGRAQYRERPLQAPQ
jgi:hypothetical protein